MPGAEREGEKSPESSKAQPKLGRDGPMGQAARKGWVSKHPRICRNFASRAIPSSMEAAPSCDPAVGTSFPHPKGPWNSSTLGKSWKIKFLFFLSGDCGKMVRNSDREA